MFGGAEHGPCFYLWSSFTCSAQKLRQSCSPEHWADRAQGLPPLWGAVVGASPGEKCPDSLGFVWVFQGQVPELCAFPVPGAGVCKHPPPGAGAPQWRGFVTVSESSINISKLWQSTREFNAIPPQKFCMQTHTLLGYNWCYCSTFQILQSNTFLWKKKLMNLQ